MKEIMMTPEAYLVYKAVAVLTFTYMVLYISTGYEGDTPGELVKRKVREWRT